MTSDVAKEITLVVIHVSVEVECSFKFEWCRRTLVFRREQLDAFDLRVLADEFGMSRQNRTPYYKGLPITDERRSELVETDTYDHARDGGDVYDQVISRLEPHVKLPDDTTCYFPKPSERVVATMSHVIDTE
jgi:hypothetical protein